MRSLRDSGRFELEILELLPADEVDEPIAEHVADEPLHTKEVTILRHAIRSQAPFAKDANHRIFLTLVQLGVFPVEAVNPAERTENHGVRHVDSALGVLDARRNALVRSRTPRAEST